MKKFTRTAVGVLILIVAVAVKIWSAGQDEGGSNKPVVQADGTEKLGRFTVLRNCRYVADEKYNDGDSFKVKTPGGEVIEIRLYYVDTAESKDKPFVDYRERVADQGKDFGGLNYQQTIALGREAKKQAKQQLSSGGMTIYTTYERVYEGDRFYAFVELSNGSWWHENLVEKGLARIHTKGVDLPDGTRRKEHEKFLRSLEKKAKKNRRGAWAN